MRPLIVALALLCAALPPATAQLSLSYQVPGVSIGINVPVFPELVRVPGYPVYYAPRMRSNYFFYDGLYWVFQGDNWYASTWYNGPWGSVAPQQVPSYVLRLPVRYYRSPPRYFRAWRQDAPPRWGEHWGPDWQHQRQGWDRWDRRAAPTPAPRPVYQRHYGGDRYPPPEQQPFLRERNYRHAPRDEFVRQHGQQPAQQQQQQQPPRQEQRRDHDRKDDRHDDRKDERRDDRRDRANH